MNKLFSKSHRPSPKNLVLSIFVLYLASPSASFPGLLFHSSATSSVTAPTVVSKPNKEITRRGNVDDNIGLFPSHCAALRRRKRYEVAVDNIVSVPCTRIVKFSGCQLAGFVFVARRNDSGRSRSRSRGKRGYTLPPCIFFTEPSGQSVTFL